MNDTRPFRLTVVFEFAGQPGHMMHSLLANIGSMLPGMRLTYLPGLFVTYRPGGFRPERIANLVWVYVRVALHLLFRRPDAVLVQSAPPGIQLWTVAWAAIGGVPVFCWLMDWHPELEARALEQRGHSGLARLLFKVDGALMPRFAAIITLDPAMTDLVRTKTSPERVLEHPTWATDGPSKVAHVAYCPGSGGGPLNLVYSGNLGAAHDLAPLRRLLESVARRRAVRLVVIGGSKKGEARFQELCTGIGLAIETLPRARSLSDLRGLYEEHRIDAGIVLLSQQSAGLVSPSKYSAYINFGLPLIYLGPPGTNAATVCLQFEGGFWLPTDASPIEIDRVASGLLDKGQMAAAAAGACSAAAHFARFDGRSLAAMLVPRLRRGLA